MKGLFIKRFCIGTWELFVGLLIDLTKNISLDLKVEEFKLKGAIEILKEVKNLLNNTECFGYYLLLRTDDEIFSYVYGELLHDPDIKDEVVCLIKSFSRR